MTYGLRFMMAAAGLALAAPAVDAQSTGPLPQGAYTVTLDGVTVYDGQDLLSYAAKVVALRTGNVRAADVAETIQQIYREDGYFLAEAHVARDGRIIVSEGRIDNVAIEGVDTATFRLIRSYVAPILGKDALRLAEFERSVMLADDIGEITVTAEVDYPPGATAGALRLVATPDGRSAGRITLDNPAREFGEAATLSFEQEFFGAVAPGDYLRFGAYGTDTFDTGDYQVLGSVTYRFPVGAGGGYLEAYGGNLKAGRDARGALLETDIDGRTAMLAFGYPMVRDVERYGYAIFELRSSGTDVDVSGTLFESGVTVASGTWLYGRVLPSGGAVEYGINLSYGERTTSSVPGDGDDSFWHLRAGVGYETPLGRLPEGTTLKAQVWGQFTSSRLPSIEEFYLGGREDERGYVFAEAQGDSGLSANIELGRDFYPDGNMVRRVRPFAFLDAGFVTNTAPSAAEIDNETLASVGFGIDAEFTSNVFLRSHVGLPLVDGPRTDAGSLAIYLALTRSW